MYETMMSALRVMPLTIAQMGLVALLLLGLIAFCVGRYRAASHWYRQDIHSWETLDAYMQLPSGWPSVLIAWAAISLGSSWGYAFLPGAKMQSLVNEVASDPWKLLFLFYLVGFGCAWLVYLFSTKRHPLLKARSLRQLLMLYSAQFSNREPSEESSNSRIDTGITSIALFSAAAAVVLQMSYETMLQWKGPLTVWNEAMFGAAIVCATIAFFCFILAADVLETLLNRFLGSNRHKIAGSLWREAVGPKYYGYLLLLAAVAVFAAAVNPVLGTLTVVAVFFIMYGFWFPNVHGRQGFARVEYLIFGLPAVMFLLSG